LRSFAEDRADATWVKVWADELSEGMPALQPVCPIWSRPESDHRGPKLTTVELSAAGWAFPRYLFDAGGPFETAKKTISPLPIYCPATQAQIHSMPVSRDRSELHPNEIESHLSGGIQDAGRCLIRLGEL